MVGQRAGYDGAVLRSLAVASLLWWLWGHGPVASAAHAAPKVVLYALGERAQPAAQRARTELLAAGFEVASVHRVAAPGASSPGADVLAGRAALSRAIEAFYANHAEEALAALAEAERALGPPSREVHGDLVNVRMWRSAISLRGGDQAGAADALALALQLDPDFVVPMDKLWPSFASFVESERGKLRRVRVRVAEVPGAARVIVDGRQVARSFEVAAGRHEVVVECAGYHARREVLELVADSELALPLDEELSATHAASLAGALLARDEAALGRALPSRRLDALVIRSDAGGARAAIIAGDAATFSAPTTEAEAIAWALRELTLPRRSDAWRWAAAARLSVFAWRTSLTWSDGSLTVDGEGGGISAALESSRERLTARASVELGRDLTTRAAAFGAAPDPGARRGGLAGALDVSLGANFEVAGRWLVTQAAVHASARTHRPGSSTSTYELIRPYSSVGLGLELAFESQPSPRILARVAGGIDPLAGYLERPRGAGDANPPDFARFEASLSVMLRAPWRIAGGFDHRRAEIQYVGVAPGALDPAPLDARQADEVNFLWIGVGRSL